MYWTQLSLIRHCQQNDFLNLNLSLIKPKITVRLSLYSPHAPKYFRVVQVTISSSLLVQSKVVSRVSYSDLSMAQMVYISSLLCLI